MTVAEEERKLFFFYALSTMTVISEPVGMGVGVGVGCGEGVGREI